MKNRLNLQSSLDTMGRAVAPASSYLQIATVFFLLLLFFAVPTLQLIWESVDGANLSFQRYREIFTDDLYYTVFLRTLRVAAICTVLSVILGFPLAYLMTTMRRSTIAIISIFVLVPLFTTILIRTYAWTTILGRSGVLNNVLMSLGLIDAPLRILGTSIAVYVVLLHVLIPIAAMVMYSSMSRIDRTLFTAAQVLGAAPVRAFVRVLVPLYMPGIISAALLVFVLTVGTFVVPPLVGGPSDTMITQLIMTEFTSMLDLKVGYALSTALLLVVVLALALSSLFVPIEQIWSLQSSQKRSRRPSALYLKVILKPLHWVRFVVESLVDAMISRPSWLVPVFVRIYVATLLFFFVAPLFSVYLMSFSSSNFLVFPPPGFSSQWYERFFASPEWRSAVFMSLKVAVVVATLATVVCAAAAFSLVRGRLPAKRMLFLFIVSPLLVPEIVVALSVYVSTSELSIVGTYASLVIGHLVGAVPLAIIIMLAAVRGLDRNLEFAAGTLGAAPTLTLRKVVLPILAPALGAAWIMSFLHSFESLLVTLFVLGRQAPTVPVKMWGDIQFQFDPVINAVSSTMITAVALLIIIAQLRTFARQKRNIPSNE